MLPNSVAWYLLVALLAQLCHASVDDELLCSNFSLKYDYDIAKKLLLTPVSGVYTDTENGRRGIVDYFLRIDLPPRFDPEFKCLVEKLADDQVRMNLTLRFWEYMELKYEDAIVCQFGNWRYLMFSSIQHCLSCSCLCLLSKIVTRLCPTSPAPARPKRTTTRFRNVTPTKWPFTESIRKPERTRSWA